MGTVTIALGGIGGYGAAYVSLLLEHAEKHDCRIVAAIDPMAEQTHYWPELQKREIPAFKSMDDFLAKGRADLAVLSLPLHLHAKDTIQCLNAGMHVLVEKPLCATIAEAHAMVEARNRAKRHVAVGYQWSFSTAIQSLKNDIRSGLFGKPRRFKCIALWERRLSYYARNTWAGMKQASDGSWIFDSPANNATAHFLHNIFYVLGKETTTSARPVDIAAELYRANAITNFDTAAARMHTEDGAEVLYYCAHAIQGIIGPRFVYEFERGTVSFDSNNYERDTPLVARFNDGTEKNYGVPEGDAQRKLFETIESARGGPAPVCGIEAAMGQTWAIEGMHRSCPDIPEFPASMKRLVEDDKKEGLVYVEGLAPALVSAYEQWKLPSDMGVAWAKKGATVKLN